MNKRNPMNKRAWMASPYVIWVIGFTVIPCLLVGEVSYFLIFILHNAFNR